MEFLVMESLKTLNKLPKTKLVTLLHPLEVRRLKTIFAAHDLSGSAATANGVVNHKGASEVRVEEEEGRGEGCGVGGGKEKDVKEGEEHDGEEEEGKEDEKEE